MFFGIPDKSKRPHILNLFSEPLSLFWNWWPIASTRPHPHPQPSKWSWFLLIPSMSLRPEDGVNIILTPHCHFQTITILLPIKTLLPLRSMMDPHHPLISLVKVKMLASGLAFSSLPPVLIPDDHYFHRLTHKAPIPWVAWPFLPRHLSDPLHFSDPLLLLHAPPVSCWDCTLPWTTYPNISLC